MLGFRKGRVASECFNSAKPDAGWLEQERGLPGPHRGASSGEVTLVRSLSLLSPAWLLSLHQVAILGSAGPRSPAQRRSLWREPLLLPPSPSHGTSGPRHMSGMYRVGAGRLVPSSVPSGRFQSRKQSLPLSSGGTDRGEELSVGRWPPEESVADAWLSGSGLELEAGIPEGSQGLPRRPGREEQGPVWEDPGATLSRRPASGRDRNLGRVGWTSRGPARVSGRRGRVPLSANWG